MKRLARLLVVLCAAAGSASARPPVIVELFTAQGCGSCNAANGLVAKLAHRPDVVALTWSVDYWDYLGWKDTWAKAEYADRQRDYEHRFALRDVFTPQVVVGGAAQTSGETLATVESLIDDARRHAPRAPEVRFLPGGRVGVGVGAQPPGGAEVWLIRFDPREQTVAIKDGDNRGAAVSESNVVRQLVRLGVWRGRSAVFKAPAPGEEGLATLVVVQGAHGGRIIGAQLRQPAATAAPAS